MKKYSLIAAVLVLTATVLAGCRNPNGNVAPSTMPATQATTVPTTHATTMPSTNATEQSNATEHTGTTENHNNATTVPGEHSTEGTNGTGEARARAPQVG